MKQCIFSTVTLLSLFCVGFIVLQCFNGKNPSGPDKSDDGGVTVGVDTSTEFEEIEVTSKGGTYQLEGDLLLTVPKGAVASDTSFTLRRIGSDELTKVFKNRGTSADNLYGAIEGKPDGMTFAVPISVSFHAAVDPGDYPVLYEIKLSEGTSMRKLGEIEADPDSDLVTITIDHFCGTAAERDAEDEYGKKECEKEPCKCKRIRTKAKSRDITCQDNKTGCTVVELQTKVDYIDCDKVFDSHEIEVGAGCKPKMKVTSKQAEVCRNGEAQVTANVYLGCPSNTMEGVKVDFNITGPATLSSKTATTNSTGNATVKLKTDEETGTVTVRARATAEWYGNTRYISFGEMQDTSRTRRQTGSAQDSVSLEVIEPTVTVEPAVSKIDKDEETELTATVSCAEKQETGTIEFSVSPNLGTVDPSLVELSGNVAATTFTGTKVGKATITAKFTPGDDSKPFSGKGTVTIEEPCYSYHIVLDCETKNAPSITCLEFGSSCGLQQYMDYTAHFEADVVLDSATIAKAEESGETSIVPADISQTLNVQVEPNADIIDVFAVSVQNINAATVQCECWYNWYSLSLSSFNLDTVHFSPEMPNMGDDFATWEIKMTPPEEIPPDLVTTVQEYGIGMLNDCENMQFSFCTADSVTTKTGCFSTVDHEGTYTMEVTRKKIP